jgi:DNA-binding CsgD family transcriptional regulator
VAGRWSLVECFVNEGRRFLVVRRSDPPGSAALTRRERQVVAYRARGYSLKLIAYELGLTASTISTHMASARTKLGFRSNVDLVATLSLNSGLDQEEHTETRLDVPAPLGLRKSTLLHAGTELWVLSFLVSDFEIPDCLSKAERHVLAMLLNGESTAQIAARRQTSLYTVCNQVASIYRKVRVGSRVELVTKLRRSEPSRSEHVRHEAHQRQPLDERRRVAELDVLEQG